MPERAEYSLNGRKVRELRQQLLVLGLKAWDQLKPMGFTQWNETEGWTGCWMERKRGSAIDSFSLQLDQEDPIRFRIELKTASKLHFSFSRTFDSIESIETDLPGMLKEVLDHVTQ